MQKSVTRKVAVCAMGCLPLCPLTQAESDMVRPERGDSVQEERGNQEESRLMKWTSMEDAFLSATRKLQLIPVKIQQLKNQLQEEKSLTKKDKKDIVQQIAELQKAKKRLTAATQVIFGLGPQRTYVYNPVKSEIYLRVGTVEQTFLRAVNTRNQLEGLIAEKRQELAEAEDEDTDELQKQLDAAVQKYRVLAAALQIIYGVSPERDYTYNQKDATLYLSVTDQELENVKQQLRELQEERANE